ncbi:hypothetical protein [Intestinibacillus sp. Marseille-P6563]|uniref:hypothetical protein n=1 Tax=Intestinibacillus sp. Marseille-P6563 TaxID=2364792 RepID=UPI000F07028D|nr:hypothetical protein [Intestinibacillus sp. Marseille-P6563]
MLRKVISGLLIMTILSSNCAMAVSDTQGQEPDSATPIELVEFVRDDSIPVPYSLDEINYSYEDLRRVAVEDNQVGVLPGDIIQYNKELLWDLNISGMEEAGEITKYKDNIIIGYMTAESYITATYYPNGDYEIYAKPLEQPEENTVIQVEECRNGVVDRYFLRKQVTIEDDSAAVAAWAKGVACILLVLAITKEKINGRLINNKG